MGISKMIVGSAVCGVLFALFSGQPLVIIGVTGPILVFEENLFSVSIKRTYIDQSDSFLETLASTLAPTVIWSWAIHNLKEFWSQICSRTILNCTLLQENVCYMLLEQYAFQIWSWSIFNLECSSRLLMVQNHKVLVIQNHMVLDHKSRPKSQKSNPTAATLLCPAVNLGVSRSLAQIHTFHYHHYAKNTGKYGAILKMCFVLNNFVYVSYCPNLRISLARDADDFHDMTSNVNSHSRPLL